MDFQCSLCQRRLEKSGICAKCEGRIHQHLDDLFEMWQAAHGELLPGKGGNGGRSSERTIGLNVAALSFIAGHDILGVLHEWEKLIRQERNLLPPALLAKQALKDEISSTIDFHKRHLGWSGQQVWIDEFAKELRELHSLGIAASRSYVERQHRIACPSDDENGTPCGNLLKVNKDDPLDLFTCRKCGSQWNTLRLVAVAMASQNEIWLDAEAIAIYYQITAKSVKQFAKRNNVKRWGQLFDLVDYENKR